MLPDWLLVIAAFEAMSFLVFGLGIATAVPEEQVVLRDAAETECKLALEIR